jgi:redox-sensitive bicupin YhaK (pirin superfamily)
MSLTSVAQKTDTSLQTSTKLKAVTEVRPAPAGHWVGDGFPVRTMFGYDQPKATTPFLLLDYAGPYDFAPAMQRRGVGEHPHRGFETVTIVYSGEVEHRDSSGGGGMIGPGDVQWMTAGGGIVHEEMHSGEFTMNGGLFHAIQLWVNLPAHLKLTTPKYQTILKAQIPEIALPDDAGTLRVIAGSFDGTKGPADTFTPVDLWDAKVKAGKAAVLKMPAGRTALLMVMKGTIVVNGKRATEAQLVVLDREGEAFRIDAETDASLLVLGGEPIDEPVFGYGPFVMNNEGQIRQAIQDYQAGRMGHLGQRR